MARRHPNPQAYIDEIDRLLMYVGRYGRQDAVAMQERIPMRTLVSWGKRTAEMLANENKNIPER